jgi:16S rRNA (guanine966-N2)-methyltransferase
VPHGLPVRPTTDKAKESIFNILDTLLDLNGLQVLDLFSGTGGMAFEFASRGATNVTCVDADIKCVKHLKEVQQKYAFENVDVVKDDVFKLLKHTTTPYDIIFADPPYALPNIEDIITLVFRNNFLKPNGLLIIEHHSKTILPKKEKFVDERVYGQSSFSFYRNR